MAEQRRRTTRTRPVSRRRDRAEEAEAEEDEPEEDEVDATQRPRRSRTRTRVVNRSRDEDDEEEEESDEDEDEEEEPEDDETEDDEEEEEEEPPRSRRSSSRSARRSRPSSRTTRTRADRTPPSRRRSRRPSTGRKKPPPGVRIGFSGAEETRKSGSGGVVRLTPDKEPELIRILEREPFASFRQHWVAMGGGQGNRPFTCIGIDCPLCESGNQSSATFMFNILHVSSPQGPENKVLQLGVTAYSALKEAATDRNTDKVNLERDYWAINRSGRKQQSQTNFQRVRERDLEEEWGDDIQLDDLKELPEIVEEAKKHLFDFSIVQTTSRRELRETARYLTDEDEDEEDED